MEEVKLIVNALVYDGELEEVRGAASRFNRDVSRIIYLHHTMYSNVVERKVS